jgi:hypothetical protein
MPSPLAESWPARPRREPSLADLFAQSQPGYGFGGTVAQWLTSPLPRVQYDEGGRAYYEGQPVVPRTLSLSEQLAELGQWAGFTLMGRGSFKEPPFSQVMREGKPLRVGRGVPTDYVLENPAKWEQAALKGPAAYHTESFPTASGYAEKKLMTDPAKLQHMAMKLEEAEADLRAARAEGPRVPTRTLEERIARLKESIDIERRRAPNVRLSYLDLPRVHDLDVGAFTPTQLQRVAEQLAREGQSRVANELRALARQSAERPPPVTWQTLSNLLSEAQASDIVKRMGYHGMTHIGGARTANEPHRVWLNFYPEREHPGFTPLRNLP